MSVVCIVLGYELVIVCSMLRIVQLSVACRHSCLHVYIHYVCSGHCTKGSVQYVHITRQHKGHDCALVVYQPL